MATGRLDGRVALVTGSASGIGAAIVTRLRSAGAGVGGLDREPGSASDHDMVVDVRSATELAAAIDGLNATLGPPDILIHAAAATHFGGCLDTDPEVFASIYEVNVVAAVRLLQLCVPRMRNTGQGAVLFVSSINASFATPTLAAYAASKAALENLTMTAALELAPDGIRVNAIAPASIDTPAMQASFARNPDPEKARAVNALRHPLARLGTAAEVAELALFLVSPQAGWITGSVYPIDGGARVTRR